PRAGKGRLSRHLSFVPMIVVDSFMKRLCDLVISGIALIILSLPILIIALYVRRDVGSPVLFRQQRPGLGGHPFELVKFRTMLSEVDVNGMPLPDDERLTKFGRLLRST